MSLNIEQSDMDVKAHKQYVAARMHTGLGHHSTPCIFSLLKMNMNLFFVSNKIYTKKNRKCNLHVGLKH